MLSQHAGILSADPLLLQQHPQIPVSISTSQSMSNLSIPNNTMQQHMEGSNQSGHGHQSQAHQSQQPGQQQAESQQQSMHAQTSQQQQQQQQQGQMGGHSQMNAQQQGHQGAQQGMVQVQVQDNLVSVIEDNKDHKGLLGSQIAPGQLQHMNEQTLTVQQLQQLQVNLNVRGFVCCYTFKYF